MIEWRDIEGCFGFYQVSDDGQVRSVDRIIDMPHGRPRKQPGVILKLQYCHGYYAQVGISIFGEKRLEFPHRLVARTFLSDEHFEGAIVCHRDGNPINNHVSNLYWGTSTRNNRDTVEHGHNVNANKTHCVNGHEFNAENTYERFGPTGRRWRDCKKCKREAKLRFELKRKAAQVAS